MCAYVESSGVQWRDCGEAITIQCRSSKPDQEHLDVKKGLTEYVSVFFKKSNSEDITIAKGFMGRFQVNGEFPDIDILIKNLTSEDTGPYWCLYKNSNKSEMQGTGSVLLVVEGELNYFLQFATRHPPYHYSTGHSFLLNVNLIIHPTGL